MSTYAARPEGGPPRYGYNGPSRKFKRRDNLSTLSTKNNASRQVTSDLGPLGDIFGAESPKVYTPLGYTVPSDPIVLRNDDFLNEGALPSYPTRLAHVIIRPLGPTFVDTESLRPNATRLSRALKPRIKSDSDPIALLVKKHSENSHPLTIGNKPISEVVEELESQKNSENLLKRQRETTGEAEDKVESKKHKKDFRLKFEGEEEGDINEDTVKPENVLRMVDTSLVEITPERKARERLEHEQKKARIAAARHPAPPSQPGITRYSGYNYPASDEYNGPQGPVISSYRQRPNFNPISRYEKENHSDDPRHHGPPLDRSRYDPRDQDRYQNLPSYGYPYSKEAMVNSLNSRIPQSQPPLPSDITRRGNVPTERYRPISSSSSTLIPSQSFNSSSADYPQQYYDYPATYGSDPIPYNSVSMGYGTSPTKPISSDGPSAERQYYERPPYGSSQGPPANQHWDSYDERLRTDPDYLRPPDYRGLPDYRGPPDYRGSTDPRGPPDYKGPPDYIRPSVYGEPHFDSQTSKARPRSAHTRGRY